MAKVYATPGVYIEEKSAFPNSAVPVATAVPAFIGYTEKAERDKKSLKLVPTRISSYNEYLSYFGGAPKVSYDLNANEDENAPQIYDLQVDRNSNFILHSSMRMFFANGGSDCYVVSAGTFQEAAETGVQKAALEAGIAPLLKEPEPTMLVIPEAVLIEEPADCFALQQAMLMHCGFEMRNRFAILDVYNGHTERNFADDDVIKVFRSGVGTNFLQWGAAYYPWMECSIVQASELDFTHIKNLGQASEVIDFEEAEGDDGKPVFTLPDTSGQAPSSLISVLDMSVNDDFKNERINAKRAKEVKEEIKKLAGFQDGATPEDADVNSLSQTLMAVSPAFKAVLADLRKEMNLLPPSATMAGIYSLVDNNIGVFQSPANVSVGSVVKPSVNISSDNQEDLNLPLNGKAVNAIRTFPGKGTLVWGARTLDGNSMDWRYVSVRRTVIFIEQSVKYAAEPYVFEPNVATTWTNLKALITNFLTNVWQQGALAGATAEDAFSVDVGLGTTMTPVDILDGIMRITVKLAVTRPAEFIVITFEQQMQKS